MPSDLIDDFSNRLTAAWSQRRGEEADIERQFRPTLEALASFMSKLLNSLGPAIRELIQGDCANIDFTALPRVINYRFTITQIGRNSRDFAPFIVAMKIGERFIKYGNFHVNRNDLEPLFASILSEAQEHYRPTSSAKTTHDNWYSNHEEDD